MNAPAGRIPGLAEVAALEQCMRRRDFAGAARLIERPATLAGLQALAAPALSRQAWQESAETYRAQAREARRAKLLPDLDEVIRVLAEALLEEPGDERKVA